MSGFELLSIIRRRFPHIPVIAISGEYHGVQPEGLIADAFVSKAAYTPEQLFARIADCWSSLLCGRTSPNLIMPQCGYPGAPRGISS